MVEFWAVDRDVYRSGQGAAADDLIAKCNALSAVLGETGDSLGAGASTARADFRGYFRDVFDANCRVREQDQAGLVNALIRVVQGLGEAKSAAKAEQARIDRAVAWQKEHDDWQARRDSGFIQGWAHDWLYSEPAIDLKDKTVGKPPHIPAPKKQAGLHEVPPPGSVAGSCSVSAARPADLGSFVSAAKGAYDRLNSKIGQLESSYDAFEAAWTWKDGACAISGMDDLIGVFRRYNQNNQHDADWVQVIADAFRAAGGDGQVVSLSDQALLLALQNAHVSVGRQALDIPLLALVGMNPSTGFADDPVNTVTGNFVEPEMDLGFTGAASSLYVSRMYNSVLALSQARGDEDGPGLGVFGLGWSSVFDQCLVVEDDGLAWVGEDGRQVIFPAVDGASRGQVGSSGSGLAGSVRASGENVWVTRTVIGQTGLAAEFRGSDTAWGSVGGRLDVWLVSDNAGSGWVFDESGAWLGVFYRPGDAVLVERDADGQVSGLVHSRGRRVAVEYVDGLVGVVRASDGRRVEYAYDHCQRLVAVQYPGGASRCYEHNSEGLIERVVSGSGVVECVNTYDAVGRVVSQVSEFERETRFVYLPGNVTAVSDPDGKRSNTWIADSKGRTIGVIDAHDQRQSMAYDANGNLVMARDRKGQVTTFTYDQRGHVIRTVLPTKAELHYEWDDCDRLTLVVAGNGSTVSYRYASSEDRDPCEIIDPAGGLTRLQWDKGLLQAVIDPEGVRVEFAYDAYGDLVASTNAVGDTARLVRDVAGRVVKAISPLGHTTSFKYDTRGNLASRLDADGARQVYAYDQGGRLVEVTAPDGGVTRMEYGPHGQLTKTTDPLGRVVERDFDDLGNVAAVKLPDGARWLFNHDALSRLTSVIDPAGNSWGYDYNINGDLVAVVDPVGVKQQSTGTPTTGTVTSVSGDGSVDTRIDFDPYGRPVKTTDASGDAQLVTYDACGRPVELVNADGGLLQIRRDRAGRVVAETSPGGKTTHYSYDTCGRLAAVEEPSGGVHSFFYDADSRLVRKVNPLGEESSYHYDAVGRLVKAFIPGLGRLERAYDPCGRLVYSRDLATGIRRFKYDQTGQLLQVTNGVGGKTCYAYDERGRLVAITDPLGNTTRRAYNQLDKVTAITDPLGRTTTATYDESGRQLTQTDPEGITLSFAYDQNGVRCATYADGRLLTRIERDLVNRTIRLIDHTDPNHPTPLTHTLTYDRLGRLVAKTLDNPNSKKQDKPAKKTAKWTYDKDGNRTSYTTTNGETITYTYNPAGQLTLITHPQLGQASFTYDQAGQLISSTHDGITHTWKHTNGFITAHTRKPHPRAAEDLCLIKRDTWGRITHIKTSKDTFAYTYDNANQLTSLTTSRPDYLQNTSKQPYQEHTAWDYNPAGQLVCESLTQNSETQSTIDYSYDEAGQLTNTTTITSQSVESIEFFYTAAGRRESAVSSHGTNITYDWDTRGWLTNTTIHNPNQNPITINTHVDGLGQLATINHTQLEWDYANPTPTLSGINNTRLLDLPGGDWLGIPNSLDHSWRQTTPTSPAHPYGNSPIPNSISPETNSKPASHTNNPTPWDNTTQTLPAGTSLTPNNGINIAGHQWLGARLYDPATHAFLTPDPHPNPDSGSLWEANPYNYANNNPLTHSDPTGYKPVTDQQLKTYNQHTQSGLSRAWNWAKNNWEYAIAGLAIGVGVAVMATGIGGLLGAAIISGALMSGGLSIGTQKYRTGHVNWTEVGKEALIGGALGAFGAGSANIATSLALKGSSAAKAALTAQANTDAVKHAGTGLWAMLNGNTKLAVASNLAAKTNPRLYDVNLLKNFIGGRVDDLATTNGEYLIDVARGRQDFSAKGLAAANGKVLINSVFHGTIESGRYGFTGVLDDIDTKRHPVIVEASSPLGQKVSKTGQELVTSNFSSFSAGFINHHIDESAGMAGDSVDDNAKAMNTFSSNLGHSLHEGFPNLHVGHK